MAWFPTPKSDTWSFPQIFGCGLCWDLFSTYLKLSRFLIAINIVFREVGGEKCIWKGIHSSPGSLKVLQNKNILLGRNLTRIILFFLWWWWSHSHSGMFSNFSKKVVCHLFCLMQPFYHVWMMWLIFGTGFSKLTWKEIFFLKLYFMSLIYELVDKLKYLHHSYLGLFPLTSRKNILSDKAKHKM